MIELQMPTKDKAPTDDRPLLMADASVIRAAIADVQDSGWECSRDCGVTHSWFFRDDEDDDQTEHRQRFTDAVIRRIVELQKPPFNLGMKLENYCPRHMRGRLPRPTDHVCADCKAEWRAREVR